MNLAAPIRHLLAALLAACVLLLGMAANAPRLHEALCGTSLAHEHASAACEAPAGDDSARLAEHSTTDRDSAAPTAPFDASATHEDGHVCAVTLFAGGCDAPVTFTLCPPTPLHREGVASYTELLLARTPRGPERVCGPPGRA